MKGKRLVPIIMSVLLLFSSCTAVNSKVEELITAPILRADQKEIVAALKKTAGENISLKYPAKGTNTSPFLSADLDFDGVDEVIAFYQSTSDGKVQVAMLDKENEKWNCSYSVSGEGSAILKADFIKFTGEREKEIVVGFTDESGNGKLSIYKAANGELISMIPFNDYDIVSYGYGITDRLLVVGVNESANQNLTQRISYYQYLSGKAEEYIYYEEITPLKTYQQIKCVVRPDFSVLVYIDFLMGNTLSTDVLKIENDSMQKILGEGYNRSVRIYCRDVNGDGILEIPRALPYKFLEGETTATDFVLPIRWTAINGSSIEELCDTVVNTSFGYYMNIPKEWENKVVFKQNASGNLLTAYVSTGTENPGMEIFSIKADYRQEESPEGYTKIGESRSVYYFAKINSSALTLGEDFKITYDELSENLKIL